MKCPHCGKNIATGTSTFAVNVDYRTAIVLREVAKREGYSVSALVNRAIEVYDNEEFPAMYRTTQQISISLYEKSKIKLEKLSEQKEIPVRALLRGIICVLLKNLS